MSWLIRMTHINHVTGQVGMRTLKMRYPNQTQARETADRLSFVRRLNEKSVIAECVAVAMPDGPAALPAMEVSP